MTAARPKRKQYRAPAAGLAALLAALGLAVCAVVALPLTPLRAAVSAPIVVDWHTGLAISGYDPVAFFTDGKPVAGSANLELQYGGVTWRFSNVGNRAAFVDDPDVYMPQYGGYDPVGVARNVAVAGNPAVWLIAGERLYLFYDGARRDQFAAEPARFISAADRAWPAVKSSLGP